MNEVSRQSGSRSRGLGAAIHAIVALAAMVTAPAIADEVMLPGSIQVSRSGSSPSTSAPDENFTGQVRIDALFPVSGPAAVSAGSITFEPGARSAWHTHPAGQALVVTAGLGWVQQWGGPVQEIRPGDVVWIPPGVKHWHGASAATAMTHTAIQATIDGRNVGWMEKVSDEQYRGK
jgi:quercetin dioxygenase-like cupin family protein